MRWRGVSLLVVCLVSVSGPALVARGQHPPTEKSPTAGPPEGRPDESSKKKQIKPYDEVITKEAKSRPGLFLTHRVEDKLYYEIPVDKLGKDMLWVWQLAETQAGYGYPGSPLGDRVVRWELRDETVLLRDVKYTIRADGKGAIQQAVEATNVAPIIKSFPVRAWGKDKAPVIEVTSLFTSDVPEFSAKRALNATGMDSSRTFLDEVKAFPRNIEVKVLATFNLGGATITLPTGGPPPRRGPRRSSSQGAVTVQLHHSMVLLPEDPMQPRIKDERVGFFDEEFEDYGDNAEHQEKDVRLITRWRLEKKDPNADVSEPKQPIVFFVGREVPDKWKPFVKKGIEYWQPAFEAAGFKNAIIGKMAPSPNEDPDWDAEDARISSIRWLPATVENAFGPHVHDPRTGEILEADVRIYHNVTKLARDWYFVQASPNDSRAQQLPLPDDLIGEILAYIVAHEVGHSLGFPHNMKASSSYTVKQLRDPEFTKKFGVEASIMDYGRFNYVAQPGDGAALIPVVGPYDFFAVEWGYRQYKNAEEEKKGLAALVAKQKDNPQLRFGNADPAEDPTRQTEDLSADPVEATELGLKNIQRVAGYLVKACCKPNKDYELLQNMYTQLLSQRTRELMHVTALVGGFEQINLFFGDADKIYNAIPPDRQRQAVKFLIENAFRTPPELVAPAITLRLEAGGAAERMLTSQSGILRSLINDGRFTRMAEEVQRASAAGAPYYAPWEMLAELRGGIWSELDQEKVSIDLYRRNLQRAHVGVLTSAMSNSSPSSDLPAVARQELMILKGLIETKVDAADSISQAHLRAVLAEIQLALDPRGRIIETTTPAPPSTPRPGGAEPRNTDQR